MKPIDRIDQKRRFFLYEPSSSGFFSGFFWVLCLALYISKWGTQPLFIYDIVWCFILVAPIVVLVLNTKAGKNLSVLSLETWPVHRGEPLVVQAKIRNNGSGFVDCVFFSCQGATSQPAQIDGKSEAVVPFSIPNLDRGEYQLSNLWVSTCFPFDLFGSRQKIKKTLTLLVYPAVDTNAPVPPQLFSKSDKARLGDDVVGLRDYVPGDQVCAVDWKASAKKSNLTVRQFEHPKQRVVVLRLEDVIDLGLEPALERLTAWVLMAEKAGVLYTLDLGAERIAAGQGVAHQNRCLRAMAVFDQPQDKDVM